MLNRLDAALLRWEVVGPRRPSDGSESRNHELADWLDSEVCLAVAPLLEREDFRRLARWSLDNLLPGRSTAASRCLAEIDAALIARALKMLEIAEQLEAQLGKRTQAATKRSPRKTKPRAPRAPSSSPNVGMRPLPSLVLGDPHAPPPDRLRILQSLQPRLQTIVSRPWSALVSEADYFGPHADLNFRDRETKEQLYGPADSSLPDWVWAWEPARWPLGDFLYQCGRKRIRYWDQALRPASATVQGMLANGGPSTSRVDRELLATSSRLHQAINHLNQLVLAQPERAQCEAAMVLVQVIAAFRPGADLGWLGPAAKWKGYAAEYRAFVVSRGERSVPEAAAAALADLADFSRSPESVDDQIAQLARTYRLFVFHDDCRREVYWSGKLLAIDWFARPRRWDMLLLLIAANRRANGGVDDRDGEGKSRRSAMDDLRSQLEPFAPDVVARKQGKYILTLPKEQVCLHRLESDNRLVPG